MGEFGGVTEIGRAPREEERGRFENRQRESSSGTDPTLLSGDAIGVSLLLNKLREAHDLLLSTHRGDKITGCVTPAASKTLILYCHVVQTY